LRKPLPVSAFVLKKGVQSMRRKSLILLIVSIGCGLIASFAVSQVMMERREGEAPQTASVIVASKIVSPMARFTSDMVRVEQWPIDRIPAGSVTDVKEVEGKYAKQRLYVGEPIIEAKLSSRGKDLVVPTGYRIFDVKVDDTNGGSGYISPGDRVDVTGFFEGGNRFPVSKSLRIMRNIEVAMVDGISFRDPDAAPKRANTIQLLVLEKQYEVLDTASNLGKLKLSLRAPEAEEQSSVANVSPDTGDSFLSWLKDTEKKKDIQAPVKSAANSLALLKDMFAAVKPKPQPQERKEIMVITPGSVSIYRWVNGRKLPVLLTGEEYYASATAEGYTNSNGVDGQGAYSNDIQGLPSSNPSSNVPQPDSTWNPNTGTWQTGGFTPVYP